MSTIRKVRRMARDTQPQDQEGAPAYGNGEVGSTTASTNAPEPKPARVTKQSLLIGMLSEEGGSTLSAIVEATGWLPHTARAALTGLRKKGQKIERFRSEHQTTYKIVAGPASVSAGGSSSASSADEDSGMNDDTRGRSSVDADCGAVAQ